MARHQNRGLQKICGCPRKTWPKCSHSWHFAFKWKATHHRFSLDRHFDRHFDSKTEAESLAEKLRTQIRAGEFGQPAPRAEMTLQQLADVYLERYVRVERAATEEGFKVALRTICRTEVPLPTGGEALAFGQWRVADLVTDTIERFREVRRGQGVGPVGVNRNLGSLRALLNWAIRTGYLEQTPFKRSTEVVVKLSAEHGRSRRLDADTDEEGRLLKACGPSLRPVVEAALETGMRRGELFSLQWKQIEGLRVEKKRLIWAPRAEIVLPWAKTKTRRDRRIPISSRLRAVLEMRRVDPSGEPLPPEAYVFGNEIGQRVDSAKRAWSTAVLKAHGHKATLTDTSNLSAESRAALAQIDLHFHDLRREAGSRWLEGGVPLHTIRDWLGHTSIAQTSTYLAGTMRTQHDAMRAYEARRASLQQLATEGTKRHQRRPRTAKGSLRKPNKTAVRLDAPVM
jgi:integrase